MEYRVTIQDDKLIISWDTKSPEVEQALHRLGGSWEDFNAYRFPFDEPTAKKVLKFARSKGKLLITREAKQQIKGMINENKRAEELTRGDADAPIPATLTRAYPKTAAALRPYQRAAVEFMRGNEATLLADDPGSGKAQPLSELVLTPEGWKTMGDIKPGSQVIGANGEPINVLKVFPQGKREVVKVTFSDGVVVRCDWDHLWHTQNKREREITGKHKVLTTREMFDAEALDPSGRSRFSIPMSEPVRFSEKPFPIDPYTWGVLTGDGSLSAISHASITTDHELVEHLVLPEGASAKLTVDNGWWGEYRLNGLSRFLREHNLNGTRSEDKVIPQEILYGSVSQRVAYLQGLLDSDGGTAPGREGKLSSVIEYGTVRKTLAYQVAELVQSLGGIASVRTKETSYSHLGEKRDGQLFYRMNIRLPEGISPFRLKRKADKWIPRAKYQPQRWIRSIEPTGEFEEMQCILVDSDDHLYLTKNYVVTHNTLQTIASLVAADVRGDILVLAPSIAVQVAWPAEIARWAPNDEILTVTGPRKKREDKLAELRKASKAPRRWILCNIEMVKTKYHQQKVVDGKVKRRYYEHVYPELFYLTKERKKKREWNAIVVDESHRALITKKSKAADQTQNRCGMGKLTLAPGGKRIAISGTPFRGKPENLWGTLNWLFPDRYTSFWDWVERWFETSTGFFGGTEIAEMAPNVKQDFYKAVQPFMLRRTKSEIAPDLPPKFYAGSVPPGMDYEPSQHDGLVGHWLEMSPKQKRAYEEMEEYATARLESGVLTANSVLAELTRLKQFSTSFGDIDMVEDSEGYQNPVFRPSMPSNKFDWLVEFLDELGIDGSEPKPDCRKVVVASQFTSIIDLFAEGLEAKGIKTLRITGKVNAKNRKAAVEAFQADTGPQVLLLNTMAGGVALTLDRADDIVIMDETFIPDDQRQVEDRVHRVSRIHNVTVHYVRSIGTIEERIAKTTFDRDSLQLELLDGARGVNIARQILRD